MRQAIYNRTRNDKMTPLLSILIPTLKSRTDKLRNLLDELEYQIQGKRVELLWLGDNRSMTIGDKRNTLLKIAKGSFVTFIDDDDTIASDYVDVLLKAIKENPNKTVISFLGHQTTDGKQDLDFRYDVRYGRNYKQTIDGKRWKTMLNDHLCCWNKSKITVEFPDKSLGEDHEFARKMALTYTPEDQVILEVYLYTYNFNRLTTETRR